MVIAVSEPIRQTLIECGSHPSRVRSIRNGIDHEVFRRVPGLKETTRRALGIPQEGLVIGAVGRIESEKRFDLLLRSAAALAPSLNTFVVIAGGGSLQNDLARLANELGIAGRVKLLGHRDDVIDIHHTFDIYAQTSVREGIPNAVLEAMAVGTPVVATDVGGTSELITDRVHGLLVPFGDCPAMTRAFESIVAHPEDAAARAAAARDRIEHELSFQVRLATIEAIYSELGDRARRGVRTRLEA
jgi:glycosyltransferase involved in cell wall biosynthesis